MTEDEPGIDIELDLARGTSGRPLTSDDREAILAWFADPCLELWREILWRVVAPPSKPGYPGTSIIGACKRMDTTYAREATDADMAERDGPVPSRDLVRDALRYATH